MTSIDQEFAQEIREDVIVEKHPKNKSNPVHEVKSNLSAGNNTIKEVPEDETTIKDLKKVIREINENQE